MTISKKASARRTSPQQERGRPGRRRSCGRTPEDRERLGTRGTGDRGKQFAKTGAKAIQGHVRARGQRQQARRDSADACWGDA